MTTHRRGLGWCALLVTLTGCAPAVHQVPMTPAEKGLSQLVAAYLDAHEKLGHAPKTADELKPFLQTYGEPDQLLVSPNDGQPVVVIWGADPTRGGPTPSGLWQILAYEQKGKGGRRVVTDIRSVSRTVSDGDFSQLTFVRGHKPAAQ